jgi:hypothetical protein
MMQLDTDAGPELIQSSLPPAKPGVARHLDPAPAAAAVLAPVLRTRHGLLAFRAVSERSRMMAK